MKELLTVQDKPPNFRSSNGKLYLVKCFVCKPEHGLENYSAAVSSGVCYNCGWKEESTTDSSFCSTALISSMFPSQI